MKLPISVVDAFTDKPFSGNTAAVVLLQEPLAEATMQSIATEMKHGATAFLNPDATGHRLRWFTPSVELELCGHATLASAHILFQNGSLEAAHFNTLSGPLTAIRTEHGVQLDFPALPPEGDAADLRSQLNEVLSQEPKTALRSRLDLLVELDSEQAVRALNPRLDLLVQMNLRGLIVTARSHSEKFDFVSRFFCPSVGISEDPVTGSAHCALGPYWSSILGKRELIGYQASKRGGIVRVEVVNNRVRLSGNAVSVLVGELIV